MKTTNFSFTMLLLMTCITLTGCGSGGGGNANRLAPWPINPQTVQMQAGVQAPNFVSDDVILAVNSVTRRANSLLVSRLYLDEPSVTSEFIMFNCDGGTCTPEDDQVDMLNLEDLSTVDEYQPVAIHNNIPLAQARFRSTNSGQTADSHTYGGWLDNSYFFVQYWILIGGEGAGSVAAIGTSVGIESGTNPTGSSSATWNGVMVGRDVGETNSQNNLIQGDATIVIDDLANPDVDIAFTRIVDLNSGTSRRDMTWENIALTSGRFQTGSAGNSIDGRFYGSSHEEVGGVFERDSILGAFGAGR